MKILRRLLLLVAGTLCVAGAAAKPWWTGGAANQNDFLAPDAAFRVSARVDGEVMHVRWTIADGYYLYRQKMNIKAESPDLMVSALAFPPGTTKTDPYLGTQEIFTQQVEGTAGFTRSDAGAHSLEIKLTYQGCAEAGLCYPPITKVIFPKAGVPDRVPLVGTSPPEATAASHSWESFAILGGIFAFFLAGLLLRRGRHLALPP